MDKNTQTGAKGVDGGSKRRQRNTTLAFQSFRVVPPTHTHSQERERERKIAPLLGSSSGGAYASVVTSSTDDSPPRLGILDICILNALFLNYHNQQQQMRVRLTFALPPGISFG
jgi:hypothetical protein